MDKERAARIIEFAFLNADGHVGYDAITYDSDELTEALQMACLSLRQNFNQHVYISIASEDGGTVADLWTCSVPDIGERMVIWKDGAFHYYLVRGRLYGANAEEKVGVWNIYVEPIKKGEQKHEDEV